MKLCMYQTGFRLLDQNITGLRSYPVAATANIKKGQYIIPSSGYATNTATAVQAAVLGIAAEDANNSSGAAGDKDVLVIPLLPSLRFSVQVEANAVITQAHIGETYDLESNDGIDLNDTAVTAGHIGFLVDDFDAGTEAVAANTYGYAIGHFQVEE